ncbi:MAG: T9SS type A sorting domain-containing protein [Ignavibacteriaceae bacterium]|nr:T9SS type A sorting domain-containing protein [Ignavibacteriaceae bacterium]
MKITFILLTIAISLVITSIQFSEPSFNGSSPGCSGSGCHSFSDGDVSVALIDSITVEVTVSGTSSRVGGELVDIGGNVVDVINSTTSNPFTLTAPAPGYYVINAGYDNPQRDWDSAAVNLIVPVELSGFIASVNENDVTLNWQTATELNNSGFDVERTEANNEWEKVGFVTGNGTTTEINSYTFTDKDVPAGTYNYRIKQIDYDGTFEYFELEQLISISSPDEITLLQNYPNPFNPSTTIKFVIHKKSNVIITIFNTIGEDVLTLVNEEKIAGSYEVNFDAAGFTSGIYFYKLQAGNFVETKKMILMK